MLVQFTVENFMSFEKETTFSMAASSSDEMHPDHLCPAVNDEKGGPLLLSVCYNKHKEFNAYAHHFA